jgi:hypothetical protein
MAARDLSPEVQRKHDALWRSRSDAERAQAVGEMCQAGRELALIGIRQRNPAISVALERWLLCELLYGQADAIRFLGSRPNA